MYTVNARIRGTTSLLQHAFPLALLKPAETTRKHMGATDYSLEWMNTMYVTADGYLYQPASHLEGALVRAATNFRIKGRSGKSWRDPIRAYCYVQPDEVRHLRDGHPVLAPGPELLEQATPHLSVHVARVVVSRSAVARSRLMIAPGWELDFTTEVHDPQVLASTLREILAEAGRMAGIGDFRPRHGRFELASFTVNGSH